MQQKTVTQRYYYSENSKSGLNKVRNTGSGSNLTDLNRSNLTKRLNCNKSKENHSGISLKSNNIKTNDHEKNSHGNSVCNCNNHNNQNHYDNHWNNGYFDQIIRNENSLLLDTLAQPVPSPQKKNENSLKKRAKYKYLTNENVLNLVDLNSDLKKSYWSSWHCSNILLQDQQKVTGKYCNNRWCIVCNRIRTAKLIQGYEPVISKFKNPYFVTLTIPNVSENELRQRIQSMITCLILINKGLRKIKKGLKAIRKIEVTYNDRLNNYHPHLHLIVEGQKNAENLINLWLKYNPESDKRGQDMRIADENSMIELFKYSTKLTVSGNKKKMIPAYNQDVIYKALKGLRTYQPIGIKKEVSENIDELQSQRIDDIIAKIDVWVWNQELKDWINSSGEFLTEQTENNIEISIKASEETFKQSINEIESTKYNYPEKDESFKKIVDQFSEYNNKKTFGENKKVIITKSGVCVIANKYQVYENEKIQT